MKNDWKSMGYDCEERENRRSSESDFKTSQN